MVPGRRKGRVTRSGMAFADWGRRLDPGLDRGLGAAGWRETPRSVTETFPHISVPGRHGGDGRVVAAGRYLGIAWDQWTANFTSSV